MTTGNGHIPLHTIAYISCVKVAKIGRDYVAETITRSKYMPVQRVTTCFHRKLFVCKCDILMQFKPNVVFACKHEAFLNIYHWDEKHHKPLKLARILSSMFDLCCCTQIFASFAHLSVVYVLLYWWCSSWNCTVIRTSRKRLIYDSKYAYNILHLLAYSVKHAVKGFKQHRICRVISCFLLMTHLPSECIYFGNFLPIYIKNQHENNLIFLITSLHDRFENT